MAEPPTDTDDHPHYPLVVYTKSMESTVIAVVSALIATVAAIAATWQTRLARIQTKHAEDVSVATLYYRIAHQFIEMDRFFVEHAELRPFFYTGIQVPDDLLLKNQIEAAAEMLYDLAELCHANRRVLEDTAHDWDKYFSFLHENSPALKEYSDRYGYLYPETVRQAFTTL